MAARKPPTRRKAGAKKATRATRAAPAKRKPAKRKAAKRAPAKRRSKFTAARRNAILAHLKAGRFRYTAAALVGIGERTLKEWLARGRASLEAVELADLEERPIPELDAWGTFAVAVAAAEAVAENDALGVVVDIASSAKSEDRDRLKAAIWYLERKHPRRYGSGAARVEVTGKDGAPIEVDARDLLLERLAKMSARGDGGEQ